MTTTTSAKAPTAPGADVRRGVTILLDQYVGARDDDMVFILYTADAQRPAAWIAAGLAVRGISPRPIGMNPVHDETLARRLSAALPEPGRLRSRIVLITVERDTMSHAAQLRQALSPYRPADYAVFRMISACEEYFTHSMNVGPDLLTAVNGGLLNRMMGASHLAITSSSGTDLRVELDSATYPWLSNRGVYREGSFMILPPGEVSTFPADINGVLVADGAYNVTTYTEADVRLAGRPVTATVEHGRVVEAVCADPAVTRLLHRCLAVPNGDRVGELGFGTNLGTPGFVAMNSHINERHPGLHLGLGEHGLPAELTGYACDIHLDLITSDATVTVDGRTRIDSRELGEFRDESHPAPSQLGIRDTDIDGDCCGLIGTGTSPTGKELLQRRPCR